MGIEDYIEQTEIRACIIDLDDPVNDIQLRAESRLVDIGVSAVEQIIEATGSPGSTVRWRAAWCLAQIRDPRGFEAVAGLLNDPDPEVRHEARESVGKFDDTRAIPLLARYIWDAEDDEDTAYHVAFYIAALGTPAVPAMIEIMSAGAPASRKIATYILGEIGDASAQEPLRTLIGDPESRTGALVALAKCDDLSVASSLIELLHIQLSLLDSDELAGEIRNHIPLLLTSEDDYIVSQDGIEYAIASLGEHSVPGLCALLPKVPAAGRKKIAWLMGLISHTSAIPSLRVLLNDPEASQQALLALGHCGDAEVLPRLLEAIERSATDGRLALRAEDSIVGLGRAAVDGLIAIATRGSDEARMRAASALGEIGAERAVDPLAGLLDSPNENVRSYALEALEQLVEKGDDALAARCLPVIEDLMSDASKWNRQAAAQSGHVIRKRLGLPAHPAMARFEREWEYRSIFPD